jgi:hypothetical protein
MPDLATSLLLVCIVATMLRAQEIPSAKASQHAKPARVTHIRAITGAGMCYGYCEHELNVEYGEAVLLKQSRDNKNKCPDLQVKADLSDKHWRELAQLVDHKALFALPDTIGCPGCVDEVTESMEITFSDHTKKTVFYNLGSAPNEIKDLSAKLEALRKKLEKEFPPITQCHL